MKNHFIVFYRANKGNNTIATGHMDFTTSAPYLPKDTVYNILYQKVSGATGMLITNIQKLTEKEYKYWIMSKEEFDALPDRSTKPITRDTLLIDIGMSVRLYNVLRSYCSMNSIPILHRTIGTIKTVGIQKLKDKRGFGRKMHEELTGIFKLIED